MAEEAQRLQTAAEAPEAAQPGLGEDLRALALISLGSTELWTARLEEAERHLERASRWRAGSGGRSWSSPAWRTWRWLKSAAVCGYGRDRAPVCAPSRARQAGDRAGRAAWLGRRAGLRHRLQGTRSRAGLAGTARRGRAVDPARRAHRDERKPSPRRRLGVRYTRGMLKLARGRDATRWPPSGPPSGWPGASPYPTWPSRRRGHMLVHVLVAPRRHRARRAGPRRTAANQERERGDDTHRHGRMLRLAQDDPHAAVAALAPVLDGSASVIPWTWLAHAFLLEAIARDALGDPGAAGRAAGARAGPGRTRRVRSCGSCCTRCRACSSARPGSAPPTPP